MANEQIESVARYLSQKGCSCQACSLPDGYDDCEDCRRASDEAARDLLDQVEILEARLQAVQAVADWIRGAYGDPISRDIEERIRQAIRRPCATEGGQP